MNDKVDPKVEKQKLWLKEIVTRVEFSVKNQDDLENRSKGKSLIDGLQGEKDSIRSELSKIEVTVDGGLFGIGGKKMKILDADGDYRKEIDTHHHASLMREAMTPQQLKAVTAQMEKVMRVQDQLKQNPYYNAGEPNFTPIPDFDFSTMTSDEATAAQNKLTKLLEQREKEEADYAKLKAECDKHMAEDLWEPMVREGIIPENFVPQDYSSVAKLFANASDAYEQRLEEYTASMSENDLLLAKFETGFKIGKGVLKLATSSFDLTGAIGDLAGGGGVSDIAEAAGEVLKHLETALTITEGFTKAALTDKDFTTVGGALAEALGTALGSTGLDPMAVKIVTTVATNAVRAVSVAKKIKAGDLDGALTDLVGAVADELANFDPDGKDGMMTLIGENMTRMVASALKGKDIGKMLAEGASPSELVGALMDAVEIVGGKALDGVGEDLMEKFNKAVGKAKEEDEEEDDDDDDDDEDDDKEKPEVTIAKGKAMEKDKFSLAKLREREKEASEKSAEKVASSMEEEIAAERAEFDKHLRNGFPMPMGDDDEINIAESERLASIDYLLAMQKKTEATIEMCKQIATKGIALVAKIFPPAALAEGCMTLAFSIKDAIEKTQELIVWIENVQDATNAKSAQVDAMLNRRGLQGRQTLRANVQVAIEAARVVAAALALTPVAGSAPIVKASADTIEAAYDLADLIYTEVQLAKAWKVYQKARDVPQDRYLARKAMRENPTLAKYAMAYGALNGDPIAVEGMRRCGLDKQVLANPGTNVDKVVSYLECKYPDDPVLLRAVPPPDKWYPGPIELTAASFMNFYRMGTTKASPKLDTTADISGVAAALSKLDAAEAAFDKAMTEVSEAAKKITAAAAKTTPVEMDKVASAQIQAALLRVQDQTKKYKPLAEDKSAHAQMAKYVDALTAKADLRTRAVAKALGDKPWEKLYKTA